MEATVKNINAVNEQAENIALQNPSLTIEEIASQLPIVVDSFTGECFTFDAAVSAWHKANPDPNAAANLAEFMAMADDSADYSDAQ
jgi:hypothetical protein